MLSAYESALLSLDGLSVGDAFGENFFHPQNLQLIKSRTLPEGVWNWTDDTHMALSIVEVLRDFGTINQDELCKRFAQRYRDEPHRGYGSGAHQLLRKVAQGHDWRNLSPTVFNGGSFGNGAAMRAAPIGGYFQSDLKKAVEEARKSAIVTHYHEEGQVGAMAVAAAASLAARESKVSIEKRLSREDFLTSILSCLPDSDVRKGIQKAINISPEKFQEAVQTLGAGMEISAQDTVPFCLWSAANHLHDFEEALWQTVSGLGDRDTTCAIVGGIVSLSTGAVPEDWLKRREELPK